jgi:hypothetical protein
MQFRQGPAHGNPCNTYSQTESYSALNWNSVVPSRVSGPATAQQVAAVEKLAARQPPAHLGGPAARFGLDGGPRLRNVLDLRGSASGRPRREVRAGSQPAPSVRSPPGVYRPPRVIGPYRGQAKRP